MSWKKLSIFAASILFASTNVSAFISQKHDQPACEQQYHCGTDHASKYSLGPTVTTSPYLGIRSAFDGHDLIVNLPTMNEDLRLLRQRQAIVNKLGADPCVNRPLLELSGDVVGIASYYEDFYCNSMHDIDLYSARFDTFAEVSQWASGYISIDYDNSSLPSAAPGAGSRLKNSRIFLRRGFLTIGDLNHSPVYFSIGQMFVPFGRYAAATLTAPLTLSIGQTNARAAVLGYFNKGFYAQAYAFRGDSKVGDSGINQWGLNAGYEYQFNPVHGEFGAGYIANIADATGIQCPTTFFGFRGFAHKPKFEQLHCRVPAWDVHGTICYGPASLIAEYINTTTSFAKEDLSYNDSGARLSALHIELHAQTCFCSRPVGGSIAYGRSCDALALNLPKDSLFFVLGTCLWKNTIQSIEYRYDCNYCKGDTAGGKGARPRTITSPGGHRQSLVGQIGVYF